MFIHIGIPGQEKGARDLETFPSMQVFKLAHFSQSLVGIMEPNYPTEYPIQKLLRLFKFSVRTLDRKLKIFEQKTCRDTPYFLGKVGWTKAEREIDT